jgi:aminobenzoyl-glutamate transport protein
MTGQGAVPKTMSQRFLDGVERVGNMVPHPVVIFLILIGLVMVASAVLSQMGWSATLERIDPDTNEIVTTTTTVRSLINLDGIRFLYESLISNFMAFTAVGLLIAVMIGAGVMEESGLVKTAIRKLVMVSPAWSLSYIVAFVGILSSLAADAGYLVLLPLAGAAFIAVGRHPLAGLALAYAAVAGAFTVNMLIKPLDAVLVQLTNDAIHIIDPAKSIGLASNLWFSIASVIFLTLLVGFLTDHVVEPRLGKYKPSEDTTDDQDAEQGGEAQNNELTAAESRGLRYAFFGIVALLAIFALLIFPRWAPLRTPQEDGWGPIIGNSPFMNGLIGLVILLFLVSGWCYGLGAGTVRTLSDVIKAAEKAVTSLGGTIFLFFVISQFVAYFVYTNIGTVMALNLSAALSGVADTIGLLPLLLGFIIVVTFIDIFIVAAIAKWAIFAPVFVPMLMKLGVTPEAVLAAYRIGDSPMNALTPVNAYFGLVVGFARKYDKNAGVGTVVALMLPYFIWMQLLWMALFAVWELLGLPWGI